MGRLEHLLPLSAALLTKHQFMLCRLSLPRPEFISLQSKQYSGLCCDQRCDYQTISNFRCVADEGQPVNAIAT